MRRDARFVTIVLVLPLIAAAEPLSPGEWLVQLGRDYPLSSQASATNADARITLAFMQAAARVDPNFAEPWYWQADMLAALDRPAESRAAMHEYIKRSPDDTVTTLRWIELSTEALQTAEQRAELCRATLRDGAGLSGEVRSDLHRRLAEYHWNRGERAQAQEQAETALADFKMNFAAQRLLDEILNVPQTPERRLEWALAGMVLDPADAGGAREIGDLLTSWGMVAEAEPWYRHAERLEELASGKGAAVGAAGASDLKGGGSAATSRSASSRPAPGTQPAPAGARAVLEGFPRSVLDYPFNPTKYLSLTWEMSRPELPPGEPWRCTVRLKNVGTFPITFGAERMLAPDLLCSITTHGDQDRTSGPTLNLSMHRRLRLAPGESIEQKWTLDIGPIRASMIGTPQMAQQVEVAGVLSPLRMELSGSREAWVPSIGGEIAPVLRFRRTAFRAKPEQVQNTVRQSQSQDVPGRIVGLELLSMLLAEHQHLSAGRLRYAAQQIDAALVERAVLARAGDADWQVRARLAECLRWFTLDSPATRTATQLVGDSHWLVRGLALRALAEQHRDKFLPVLETTAQSDGDEWVRGMAAALAERMKTTGKQPAATQPGGEVVSSCQFPVTGFQSPAAGSQSPIPPRSTHDPPRQPQPPGRSSALGQPGRSCST